MKRIYLSTIFTLLFVALFAQSIEVTDHNNNIKHFGDTVRFLSTNSDLATEHIIEFTVKNTSSSNKSYKVRKTYISILNGSENVFCFGQCYIPSVFVSPSGLTLAGGASTSPGAFAVHYTPNSEGMSIIAYSVFDENNPADSTYFIVKYYVAVDASISTTTSSVTISDAYPNPAKDYFFVDYEINNAQMANIEVVNILGSVVFNQEISTNDSRA